MKLLSRQESQIAPFKNAVLQVFGICTQTHMTQEDTQRVGFPTAKAIKDITHSEPSVEDRALARASNTIAHAHGFTSVAHVITPS